jgi:erythromycin esterase-like protein
MQMPAGGDGRLLQRPLRQPAAGRDGRALRLRPPGVWLKMNDVEAKSPAGVVRAAARPLAGTDADYDALLEQAGAARFVLLGEASHGTEEFYRARAEITRRLILEKGFTAVAVEADWPDAYRVNRYVLGRSDDRDADQALDGFRRFPTWMWRNTAVLDFVDWLKKHNAANTAAQAGFYGLDLYSLRGSMDAVLGYLEKVDPEAARRARLRYSCFDHFGDPQAYGYAAAFGVEEPCERAVVEQLVELRRRASDYAERDGQVARAEFFYAEQNARLVKNAEEYYRSMFRGRAESWNRRDRHMAETLEALVAHLHSEGREPRVVVWAHNSHLGDARATEMGEGGELNLGQLVRERYGAASLLVGFTTHTGSVTAADDWNKPPRRKRVRPSLEGSYERLFHETGLARFYLNLRVEGPLARLLGRAHLERAIGVIYHPETERWSHYFNARLPEQFDAVFHFDETRAVEPLEPSAGWQEGEPPETYPTGM